MKDFNNNIPSIGFYDPNYKKILEKNHVDLKIRSKPNFKNNENFDLYYPIRTQLYNAPTTSIPDNFMNPVVVSPTSYQINNGSRVVPFSSIENPPNNICVITRETFNATDMVRQLTACGHIFNDESIQQWFELSVYCPMCRHDIRTNNRSPSRRRNRRNNRPSRTNQNDNHSLLFCNQE